MFARAPGWLALYISPLGRLGGRQMVSLIVEWALFFLVLFFLLPGMIIFAMLMRNVIHHNLKHMGWHKEATGKSTGW